MDIQYIDRKTAKLQKEKIYGDKILSLLYGDSLFSQLFSVTLLPLLSKISWFSKFYGFLQTTKKSSAKVDPFIAAYQIDKSEFIKTQFCSFNDFFIRKLKPEKRPIIMGPQIAALPADGRYLVFPQLNKVDSFYVKGQNFDLCTLLQDGALSRRLASGSMMIARLCPVDYHRFHFICDGVPSKASLIPGPLFSVNPVALRKKLSILSENKRMITEVETKEFGTIFYIEVGATCVGTIHQTYVPDQLVKKGDEKGYFSFGGSCLIILFEEGRILFDEDLIQNSKNGIETYAQMGGSLGIAD
jgi:phosphatidylserine decarboxylase